MPYSSNLPAVADRLRRANDAGLMAGAALYRNRMKVALARGYTSGAFVTGQNVEHVVSTAPMDAPGGGREVRTGTDLMYALWWEIGHVNLFVAGGGPEASNVRTHRIGHFVRVEKWRPVLVDSRTDIQREYERVFGLVMRGGA